MSDNNIIKTYISILNEILAMELTSTRLESEDEEELNEIEKGYEIWNNKFDLDNINFLFFLEKLEEQKMLKVYLYKTLKPSEKMDGILDEFYGKEMKNGDWLSVNYGDVNKDLIIKYRDELKSIYTPSKKETESIHGFWITKNNEGDYLFDGNIISISKEAEYTKILDAIYSLKPNGGDILYKEIEKVCRAKKLKVSNKTIQRALTGKSANLFRFTKNIKQFPKYGIPLFQASSDGKYITFNNKK